MGLRAQYRARQRLSVRFSLYGLGALRTEADEENAFVKRARRAGFLCRKMNGDGYKGWPDQLVEGLNEHWYIEFKRPGRYKDPNAGLSANQAQIIAQLRALGKKVLVTDSAEEAWEFIHDRLDADQV